MSRDVRLPAHRMQRRPSLPTPIGSAQLLIPTPDGALVEWEDEGVRAVRIHGKQDMRTEQVPSPEPDVDEVRLRVGYVGICGSDLHYFADGAAGIFVIREPLIPGHEVSGVIDLDPTGVLKAGTPVTVHPATWGAAQPDLTDEQRHLWPGAVTWAVPRHGRTRRAAWRSN